MYILLMNYFVLNLITITYFLTVTELPVFDRDRVARVSGVTSNKVYTNYLPYTYIRFMPTKCNIYVYVPWLPKC